METLFHGVATHHRIDVARVRQYRLDRDLVMDSIVILSFAVLFAIAAYGLAGLMRRRLPPDERGVLLIATVAVSILHRHVVIEDPDTFVTPVERHVTWLFTPGEELFETICAENNKFQEYSAFK